MIEIICKYSWSTYNSYHIVKAFFPVEKITQQVNELASDVVRVTLPDGGLFCVQPNELMKNASRSENKYYVDRKLYRYMEAVTKKQLSWGLLTGVRPTKIIMEKLQHGMDEDMAIKWFGEDLLVSAEKAKLAWDIATKEKMLLDQLDCEKGYSLYIGIPFCPTVCSYCSFSSGSLETWRHHVESYLDALCKELLYIAGVSKGKKLNTIYIGGGTPTTLTEMQLERLLSFIDLHFARTYQREYTVEAGRPDSITKEKLNVLYAHGVTRISVNPQSMQQKTLDIIGRKHTVRQTVEAYEMAREIGFDNINMDLIAGLPGEMPKDMEDTLRQIEKLKPDSLTVHALAIKRAALMGQEQNVKGYIEALNQGQEYMEESLSAMITLGEEGAKRMGLVPYYLYRQKNIAGNFENVGYAKVDKAGIYNILIMEEKQSIIAVGAGASTKIVRKEPVEINHKKTNIIRVENVKAIDVYIERIEDMIERKGEWLWH